MGDILIRIDAHLAKPGQYLWDYESETSTRIVAVWRHPGNVVLELADGSKRWLAPHDPIDIEELS